MTIAEAAEPLGPGGPTAPATPPSGDALHRVIEAQRALACAEPDADGIFALLADLARSVLDAEGALTSQPEGDSLVARATTGSVPVPKGDVIPLAGTLGGLAVATRMPQLCHDGRVDPRTDPEINRRNGTLSSVVVPLVHDDEVIGVVAALSSRPDAFDETDLALLAMLADVAAHRLGHALARRAAERVIRESEQRLAAAQQLTGLASWTWDVEKDRHSWSEQMFRLVGLDPSAEPPNLDGFLRLVHPEDREASRRLAEGDLRARDGQQEIFRVIHPDGSQRYLQAWTEIERHADGTARKVWGATLDVTQREEATRALAAGEQHFRVAFDNAPIGMSMISLLPGQEGRYLRANDAFCAMLGYSPDEITSLDLQTLTHPGDLERTLDLFHRVSRGETRSVSVEKRYLHRDGRSVHAWVTSAVAQDAEGGPLFLISHAMDMTDRRKERAELERLALTDTLTGLANRTLLGDRLDQALARLDRRPGACAFLLLDVDRFKLVNDSLGHQVGDQLLVEVASRLEAVVRADSTVARLGGDEFVVLTEGLDRPEDVHPVTQRLLEVLRRPYTLEGSQDTLVATVSIGISFATTADRSPTDIYREADLALYRAKDSGRDQYAVFDDDLRARAVARMEAESLLRRALADDLLVPVYQPIVDLTEGRITAVEVLARIRDGDRLVTPDAFVDVAEETGLIVEVDARMFELATGQFARWRATPGLELRRLSANISARSLEDPSFVERMRRAMTWFDVPGSAIRVELTEHSLLTSSPAAHQSLRRVAALGVGVGLDDFGTGYSALAYLQRFQLDFLKIDRSFIARLGRSARDDAVVSAVIDLAHAHDLIVIAEGVETREQLAAVREMGCDRAQGYLMGRPMEADAVAALIAGRPAW